MKSTSEPRRKPSWTNELSPIIHEVSSIINPLSSTKCHPSSILYPPPNVIHPPSSIIRRMSSIIHEIISIQFHKATKKTKLDQRKHPPSSILHGHSYYYNMEDEMMTDDSGCQSLAEHFAGNKTMYCYLTSALIVLIIWP